MPYKVKTKFSEDVPKKPMSFEMEQALLGMNNLDKKPVLSDYQKYLQEEQLKENMSRNAVGSDEWYEKSSGRIDLSPVNVEDAFLLPYLGAKALSTTKLSSKAAKKALPKYVGRSGKINLTHPRSVRESVRLNQLKNESSAKIGVASLLAGIDYLE